MASAPHLAHRTDAWPTPSMRVSGHSVPHSAHTGAQYGSPLKRPSIGWSLPEAVASDVTSMSRIRIAIASPTRAPSTATGEHTSWPPRIDGVIIGPQQPGVVFTTMCPPSATGPSIGTSGPSRPSVKVSTNTVWRAWRVSMVATVLTLLSGRRRRRQGSAGRPRRPPLDVAHARRACPRAPAVRRGERARAMAAGLPVPRAGRRRWSRRRGPPTAAARPRTDSIQPQVEPGRARHGPYRPQ